MNDEDGPFVASIVYAEIAKSDSFNLDTIPYALDLAVHKLQSRGVSPYRWAPFIHMGA